MDVFTIPDMMAVLQGIVIYFLSLMSCHSRDLSLPASRDQRSGNLMNAPLDGEKIVLCGSIPRIYHFHANAHTIEEFLSVGGQHLRCSACSDNE